MKRFTCLTLLTFFAVAAGCSASGSSGSGGTDDDAGTTTTKDAGKKDGSSSTTDEGGTTTGDAGTKSDAKAKDAGDTDADMDIDADTDADTDAATTDGSTTDAAGDGSTTTDGSTATDAATDADAGPLVCAPANVSGFTPTWKQPNALHQNKCTTQQVDAIMDACADVNSTQQDCDNALAAAPAACKTCLITDESASTYGPIVVTFQGIFWNLNVAGCIARTQNDLATTGCGAKVQAYDQCVETACDANCADITDINDYYMCQDDATGGGCATRWNAADTCETAAFATDAAAEVCDPNATGSFLDNAKIYGKLFCTP